jgi:hypothetical protein
VVYGLTTAVLARQRGPVVIGSLDVGEAGRMVVVKCYFRAGAGAEWVVSGVGLVGCTHTRLPVCCGAKSS